MHIINLRKHYPHYTEDIFLEVSDEVYEVILHSIRQENNYTSRKYYHKAQYSLDCGDGIENDALHRMPSPEEIFMQKVSLEQLYAYLHVTRGIDSHIIKELFQKEYIYEDIKGNAVFVGYDEQGKPRYATLRGTYADKPFRMDCVGSDKRYGFCMNGSSSRLYIFESAIDSLSHATLENRIQGSTGVYRADSRLSLGGTSGLALAHYLQRHTHITELVFCLDNDDAGRKRAVALAREYADKGYYTRLELPTLKDYNEVLLNYLKRNGGQL